MASDWVAPVATTVAGGIGVFFTWLTGKQGRDHLVLTTGEDRRYQRRADAYVELLTMTERIGNAIASLHPEVRFDPPLAIPEIPTDEEQARVFALISAFGTPEIRTQFITWRDAAQEAIGHHRIVLTLMEERRQSAAPGPPTPLTPALNDLRRCKEDEQNSREALGFLVREALDPAGAKPTPVTNKSDRP